MIVTDIIELKKVSEEVELKEVDNIVKQLEEELDKHKTGIGLSAIQIGLIKKVAIIKLPKKEKIVLYNAKILEKSEKFRFKNEGCLSIPGLYVDTRRYNQITVENNGEMFCSYGLEAVAIQHEIDHMNGILILNRKWKRRGRK